MDSNFEFKIHFFFIFSSSTFQKNPTSRFSRHRWRSLYWKYSLSLVKRNGKRLHASRCTDSCIFIGPWIPAWFAWSSQIPLSTIFIKNNWRYLKTSIIRESLLSKVFWKSIFRTITYHWFIIYESYLMSNHTFHFQF